MTCKTPFRWLLPLAFAIGVSSPVTAHEGHREDMSDAEMAQVQMHEPEEQHFEDAENHMAPMLDEMPAHAYPQTVAQDLDDTLAQAIRENRATSASDLIGRLHPIAAHFPIALLLTAGLAEILLSLRPSLGLETTIRFLVAGGALSAVLAALLGWFAGGWRLADRSETLSLHRWNGTAIAGVALMAVWFAFRTKSRSALRVALAVLAVALVAQGYLGGEMVFGPNHLGI